jgi:hypothetical protein
VTSPSPRVEPRDDHRDRAPTGGGTEAAVRSRRRSARHAPPSAWALPGDGGRMTGPRRPSVASGIPAPPRGGVLALADSWRARATELRTWAAAEQAATALERAAEELEAELHADDEAELNLEQAAAECGYSARHLARLIGDGTLGNAGRKNAPRIRRADLPRKPGNLPLAGTAATLVGDRGRIARAVADSRPGD